MVMDQDLFLEMLRIESTSSNERGFAEWLAERLRTDRCTVEKMEVGDGTMNLLFSWGVPETVFCTHMDTVPPYIAPTVEDCGTGGMTVRGRGSCDAKGQIFAMYNACRILEEKGMEGFGLLLLSGEETGSFGAKSFRTAHRGGDTVIVGEPTDNCMVSASKGTKSFAVTIHGKSFHSGYPQYGKSAVDGFMDFMDRLRQVRFPSDPELGDTTWNIGKLHSDNPQNILSDLLRFRIYFRTTFASDSMVCEVMESMKDSLVEIEAFGGDTPTRYTVLDGFRTKTVAFGSDAPQLTNFRRKILYGPGSILVAHTSSEHIRMEDIRQAADDYVKIFETLASGHDDRQCINENFEVNI